MPLPASFDSIVLIAESLEYDYGKLTEYDRNIDIPHKDYINEMMAALRQIHPSVILYHSPAELMQNIDNHKNDIIFPYWSGKDSRNRHALIPAICEASGVRYIGGDAYTKIVCNDKALAKVLCQQAGLSTPKGVTLFSMSDRDLIETLTFPMVVKPMFEGSSLGITEKNLVHTFKEAAALTERLYHEFNQPILVEEFIPGREISLCLVGWQDHILAWAAAERYVVGDDSYFINRLYSFEEKRTYTLPLALRDISPEITPEILESCRKLFQSLDKIEYTRVDGRLNGSDFVVIELTPETHLGPDAEFCGTFTSGGKYTYPDVIEMLVKNCLERDTNTQRKS